MKKKQKNKLIFSYFSNTTGHLLTQGFTFVEVLLAVALVAIVMMFVVRAIDPVTRLAETRNAQRRADALTISNALYQNSLDNGGTADSRIPSAEHCTDDMSYQICKTDASSCAGFADFSFLTDQQRYLVEIPVDPDVTAGNGTGYHAVRNIYNRIEVCAPLAEDGMTINIVR